MKTDQHRGLDMCNLRLRGANLQQLKGATQTFKNSNLGDTVCEKANYSMAIFIHSNLARSNLSYANLIFASISESTILNEVDVGGALLIEATTDTNKPVTHEWLKAKGAKNSNTAITTASELLNLVNSNNLSRELTAHYIGTLNDVYGALNSQAKRGKQTIFIEADTKRLSEFSTDNRISMLRSLIKALIVYEAKLNSEVELEKINTPVTHTMRR